MLHILKPGCQRQAASATQSRDWGGLGGGGPGGWGVGFAAGATEPPSAAGTPPLYESCGAARVQAQAMALHDF